MHRVDPDAILGELHGRGLGHGAHGTLSGVVTHMHEGLTGDPRYRRDVDDGPSLGLLHHRNDGPHAEEHTLGVDAHLPVPGGHAETIGIAAADAGIVDQDIDATIGRKRGGNGGLPIGLAGNVVTPEASLAPCRCDRAGNFATFRLQQVGEDHLCPLAPEQPCGGRTHAGRCPRDNRDLACKTHNVSPSCCRARPCVICNRGPVLCRPQAYHRRQWPIDDRPSSIRRGARTGEKRCQTEKAGSNAWRYQRSSAIWIACDSPWSGVDSTASSPPCPTTSFIYLPSTASRTRLTSQGHTPSSCRDTRPATPFW